MVRLSAKWNLEYDENYYICYSYERGEGVTIVLNVVPETPRFRISLCIRNAI